MLTLFLCLVLSFLLFSLQVWFHKIDNKVGGLKSSFWYISTLVMDWEYYFIFIVIYFWFVMVLFWILVFVAHQLNYSYASYLFIMVMLFSPYVYLSNAAVVTPSKYRVFRCKSLFENIGISGVLQLVDYSN